MLLRRYGPVCVLALPAGFAMGALLFGFVAFTGNPDARPGWPGIAGQAAAYGTVGAVVALCAAAAGIGLIGVVDSGLRRTPGERVLLAAAGSGAGTVTLAALVEVVSMAASAPGNFSGTSLFLGLLLSVPAAGAAAVLVFGAEAGAAKLQRARRTPGRR
jgi:hypothetical protein